MSPLPAPVANSSSAKAKLAKNEGLTGVKLEHFAKRSDEGVKLKLDAVGFKGLSKPLVSKAGVRVFARKAEQAEEEEEQEQVVQDVQAAEGDL